MRSPRRSNSAILHEQDLNVSATGFVSGRPAASNRQFGQWATSVSALTRYPELIGFGQVLKVPAGPGLRAFAARAILDPVGPLAADGSFQVVPPGPRACLLLPARRRTLEEQEQLPARWSRLLCPGSFGDLRHEL